MHNWNTRRRTKRVQSRRNIWSSNGQEFSQVNERHQNTDRSRLIFSQMVNQLSQGYLIIPHALISLLFAHVLEPISGFFYPIDLSVCSQVRILIDIAKRRKESGKSAIK